MRALALALALLFATPLAADAQAASRAATARALFQEGVALARQGDYGPAIDRFRRSSILHPAAAVTYNLASALAHEGALVEASELLTGVLRDASVPDGLRRAAERLQSETTQRIAHLTLRADGAIDGARIELDGEVVDDAAIGVPVAVDPGEHTVDARRGLEIVATERTTLGDGERREVVLHVTAPEPVAEPEIPPAAVVLAPAPPEPAVEAGPAQGDDATWIGIGIAVAVVAASAVTTGIVVGTLPSEPVVTSGNAMPGVLSW